MLQVPDPPAPGDVHVVALPLTTRFRGLTVRETLLVRGPSGWGEWAAFAEYDDAEATRWLAACYEASHGAWSSVPAGTRVPVNATVPAVPAADVPGVLARFPGCTTAKVKVAEPGQSLADDVARVAAVRDALGPSGSVRVDANAGWSDEQAVDALRALAAFGLEYAEQPVAGVDGLARLRVALARAGVDVPVAADEVVRRASDPLAVARAGAADVVVVKAAPLGGVAALVALARELRDAYGVLVTVSSALESSVGLAAGAVAAAALGDGRAAGLGTAALLAGDVTGSPLLPRDGAVDVRRVTPDAALLEDRAAPPERQAWWRERLARVHGLLAAQGGSSS
ncbi:o-succinylbenzoate synthase [Aquipuribacter sp. SD81]|uniref:o-succinylbenzoate synthase n=1 Tax=Aquipuribacter sp. SD81 TaxID=3127703 RepID=UPI003016CB54